MKAETSAAPRRDLRMEVMTFRPDGPLDGPLYEQLAPHVWNGRVFYRKVRITVEVVAEPMDVVADRLRRLYVEASGNMHHREAVSAQARKLGINLDAEGR